MRIATDEERMRNKAISRKVLLVDDDKYVRDMNRVLLRARGFKTLEAENGNEATIMLAEEHDLNLAIVDIRMPVVDGAALVDMIRLCSPKTKIVVSSVYPLDDQRRLISNADAYHEKTEGLEVLLLRIDRILPKSTH